MAAAQALHAIDPSADAERLHAAMARWRRRSHLIRFFRRALPMAMAAMVLGLLGWMAWQAVTHPEPKEEQSVSIRMVNPRFRGRDDEGRPFTLAASEASRDSRNFHRVILKDPFVSLQDDGSGPMTVRARRGVYNERTLIMVLEGAVHMVDPAGWVFDSERAIVDTNRNVVSGDLPVVGVGPAGRIAASSYVVYNQGERVVFKGKVRTTLNR